MVCNFRTETTIYPNTTNPAERDHKPITYTLCSMKQWTWNGNMPSCICDGEENCVHWMSSSHKKELLMKKKVKCSVCKWGYGLWAIGEPVPMGEMDAKDGMPTIKCTECGANHNPIKERKQ